MIRLDHEFVRRRRRLSAPGALLLAAGVFALGGVVERYVAVNRNLAEVENSLATTTRRTTRVEATAVDLEQMRARMVLAGQVVKKRTIPWDRLFRDIEEASSADIGVLSIEPEAGGGIVRINGDALDAAALSAYVMRLEEKSALRNVHLIGHELRQEQGRPVLRFVITANWTVAAS
jgi:Fimbrial assembly protein (PilN)